MEKSLVDLYVSQDSPAGCVKISHSPLNRHEDFLLRFPWLRVSLWLGNGKGRKFATALKSGEFQVGPGGNIADWLVFIYRTSGMVEYCMKHVTILYLLGLVCMGDLFDP